MYIPDAGAGAAYSYGNQIDGLFDNKLRADFWSDDSFTYPDKTLYYYATNDSSASDIVIYCNDIQLELEIIDIGFNPTPHEIN